VNKSLIGKYINSKKYGSCVQLYHRTDGDITYLACFKDKTKLGKDGKPLSTTKYLAGEDMIKATDNVIKYLTRKGFNHGINK